MPIPADITTRPVEIVRHVLQPVWTIASMEPHVVARTNWQDRSVPCQTFYANGLRKISRIDIEEGYVTDVHETVAKLIDEMYDNLDAYLYVTSPVRAWRVPPTASWMREWHSDSILVTVNARGWFDSPRTTEVERIDL
jgi:hypothetical protein